MEAAGDSAPAASRTLAADADRPRGVMRRCSTCGTPVTRRPSKMRAEYVFCGRACRGRHPKLLERRIAHNRDRARSIDCAWCGESFTRSPSKIHEVNYCSKLCAGAARRAATAETAKCSFCGGTIERPRSMMSEGDRHFCDRRCYQAMGGRERRTWIEFTCEQCGDPFFDYVSQRRRFCSTVCKGRYHLGRDAESATAFARQWRQLGTGKKRQEFIGAAFRRANARFGQQGGPKRGWEDRHLARARELRAKDRTIGRGRLAIVLGITEKQARAILNRLHAEARTEVG